MSKRRTSNNQQAQPHPTTELRREGRLTRIAQALACGEMRAMFYRTLRVVEHAFSARREYMTKDGQIVYGGPDHYARLAATKHLRDFLSAGRPAPKRPEKEERRGLTLPELENLLKTNAAQTQTQ